MGFRSVKPQEFEGNLFDLLGRQWALIGTRKGEGANLMTASWGAGGILWNNPCVFVFVRHSRYTHELMDAGEGFSLTFYGEHHRKELALCGRESGRDMDKVAACGFTTLWEGEIPYTEEAETVFLCRKIGKAPLGSDAFLDPEIPAPFYQDGDYHDIYVGQIERILVKE